MCVWVCVCVCVCGWVCLCGCVGVGSHGDDGGCHVGDGVIGCDWLVGELLVI